MQLSSEVLQPFSYLFVSIWRGGFNFTSNVKSAWLSKEIQEEIPSMAFPKKTISLASNRNIEMFQIEGQFPVADK